ncbi:MAG: hypothetical protein JW910_12105, partial [Anaerolineae bacterium]|nr:hypothetical protein [Anaerolineae bacterium]
MHRRLVIGILLACLLALPVLPALALGSGTPISPANAVGVVELARFGRGLVYDLAWTPDGGSLVVAGAPGVWVYNAADVTAAPRLLAGHTETVRSVDVSPTGALIVSGSVDDSVRLWDTASGAQVLALQDATTAARDLYVVRFFPDGSRVAAAGGDYTVHVWNTDGTLVYTLAGHTRTINALAL